MKTALMITSTLSLLASLNVSAAQNCEDLTGCEAKVCHIEKQLEYAKQNNNVNKVQGLTKALNNVKEHCTVGGLKDDLQDEIADIKDDLAEHQDDLKEAMQDQEADKVEKYQQRVAEDQEKLKALQAELLKLK
ncbi:DUF1090 domain-containing protein [Vibrio rumoiensis]|uniref:DUF1090 domain-containing protein n=1 Tax=Vibrio rumoiensis TaxID=76258 RepID=UPI000B5CCF2F|nr:DUF1090 domain-containing protein [Vibrio rumoiensis]